LDVLYDARRWPSWWRGVERTAVLGDDVRHPTFSVTFEFEIVARGDLAGTGR